MRTILENPELILYLCSKLKGMKKVCGFEDSKGRFQMEIVSTLQQNYERIKTALIYPS